MWGYCDTARPWQVRLWGMGWQAKVRVSLASAVLARA